MPIPLEVVHIFHSRRGRESLLFWVRVWFLDGILFFLDPPFDFTRKDFMINYKVCHKNLCFSFLLCILNIQQLPFHLNWLDAVLQIDLSYVSSNILMFYVSLSYFGFPVSFGKSGDLGHVKDNY